MIMFQAWRYQLRQAQVALDDGRLEEAARLLREGDLPTYLPAQQMLGEVARQIGSRAMHAARSGDWQAAWRDLDAAKQLQGESSIWLQAQQAVVDVILAAVVKQLQAGETNGALTILDSLQRRKLAASAVHELREVARRVESAQKLAQRGKFSDCEAQLEAALQLRPDLTLLAEQREACRQKGERYRLLHEQLHRSLAAEDWTEALRRADEVLEFAPQCRVWREARRRAWEKVGAKIPDSQRLGLTTPWNGSVDAKPAKDVESAGKRAPRFLMWVDAVGGYLVCLGDEIVIGQAGPVAQADVPIQADISRQHLKIMRQGEGYVVAPLSGAVKVNSKPISSAALLSDGDELLLGEAVRLRFRKPHALSASARLEIVSRHRTQPFADAVLLMAESCVLGPKWQNHVICRDWSGDVVLYRNDGKLFCRAMESVEIDGTLHETRGPVQPTSRIVGNDFTMSLEPLT
jgi:tetratricopeptide (TPR) repeat protein